jgi:hypothetical protein
MPQPSSKKSTALGAATVEWIAIRLLAEDALAMVAT